MPPQDGYFFFWSEMLPFVPHTFRSVILTDERLLHFQLRRDRSPITKRSGGVVQLRFWLRLGDSRVHFHDCEDVIRITAVKHRRGVYR